MAQSRSCKTIGSDADDALIGPLASVHSHPGRTARGDMPGNLKGKDMMMPAHTCSPNVCCGKSFTLLMGRGTRLARAG